MQNDLVSIIMPAYNCENLINHSIDSVINQTYDNWELIIVDDYSKDKTFEVISKYSEKDSRIKVFRQLKNNGVSAARNVALTEARGRFIAFLDSDDIWKKNKLQLQIEFMIKNNYSFSFTSYELIHESGEKLNKIFEVPTSIKYREYLKNTIIGCLTVMLDRKRIGEINIPNTPLEDVVTWMTLLRKGTVAYGLNSVLAEYRITSGSVSRDKIANAKKYYSILRNNQKLSLLDSLYCHFFYILNAIKKRIL